MKKTMLFYRNYFGFESPFQVLIDGTFCKEALKVKVDIREQLPKYLDSEVNLLTTACARMECELFGSSHGKSETCVICILSVFFLFYKNTVILLQQQRP